MGIATDLILIVLAGLIGGLIARRFNQPLIIGYILAGIALGPYTGGATISQVTELENLAEIGVALLLFTLGLEFPINQIKPIWKIAFLGSLIQVALTLVLGYAIGNFLGWSNLSCWWFAVAIVSSSTSITMKTLISRRLMGTLSSRVMLGMSIIQDITVIPMLVVLANFTSGKIVGLPGVMKPILVAAVFIGIMLILGARLIPFLLKLVANWNSRELFLLAITAVGLGIGYVTRSFNLSFSFGAFVAGIVLSRSDYVHKALSDLIPVRDIFGLLFFVSIGMLMNPTFLYNNFQLILTLTLVIGFGRGLLLSTIGFCFGYRNIVPMAMFFGMIPISEISFILARSGLETNGISPNTYSIILSTVVASMVLGPLFAGLTRPCYNLFRKFFKGKHARTVKLATEATLENHVVIIGGGQIVTYLGSILNKLGQPYVIVENNHRIFQQLKKAQFTTIFGDACESRILQAAALDKAKILLIANSGLVNVLGIISKARKIHPSIRILARAERKENIKLLRNSNVDEIIQPELEAGLEMARQTLLSLNLSALAIQPHLDSMRKSQAISTETLQDTNHSLSQLLTATKMLDLRWILVSEVSPLANKTLFETGLRRLHGLNVVGIIRNHEFSPSPSPNYTIMPNDYVAVIGAPEKLNYFISSTNITT